MDLVSVAGRTESPVDWGAGGQRRATRGDWGAAPAGDCPVSTPPCGRGAGCVTW